MVLNLVFYCIAVMFGAQFGYSAKPCLETLHSRPVTQSDWEHLNFLRYGAVARSPVSVQFFNASIIHDQSDCHDGLEGGCSLVVPDCSGFLQAGRCALTECLTAVVLPKAISTDTADVGLHDYL
jgi:hypothetical protein